MSICKALFSLLKVLRFDSSNEKSLIIYYHKFLTDKYLCLEIIIIRVNRGRCMSSRKTEPISVRFLNDCMRFL